MMAATEFELLSELEEELLDTGYQTSLESAKSALDVLSPSELKAVRITSTFETGRAGGFGGLTGNFDGQGLSFGLLNFTIKAGSLIPLLKEFISKYPRRYSAAFGKDADRFKEIVFATKPDPANPKQRIRDVERQMAFVNNKMNAIPREAKGNRIIEPWRTYFRRLEEDPEFKKIQVKAVRGALDHARDWFKKFGFKTERGFAFMFDLVSSHGGWWLDARKFKGRRIELLKSMLDKKRAVLGRNMLTELETMEVIANMIAQVSSQKWQHDVLVRKLWFVRGSGTVHGRRYDIKKNFGVTDNVPDFGMNIRPAAKFEWETFDDDDLHSLDFSGERQDQPEFDESESWDWDAESELELMPETAAVTRRLAGGRSTRSPPRSVPSRRQRPGPAAPVRAPLPSDVHGWILDTNCSALELIADPALRNRFLREINLKQEHFHGNLAEELFEAMARVVPEWRVPETKSTKKSGSGVKYRPDIANIVVPIPGEPKCHFERNGKRFKRDRKLHPEASEFLVRMRDAAAKDGIPIRLNPGCLTAWRTPEEQRDLSKGKDARAVAKGIGPHVYGLAVDLRLGVMGLQYKEATTEPPAEKMANIVSMYRSPVYKWMALYGSKFGWFPYKREPWHWEYNPPGFKERYEGWPGKNREVEFESEFDLEEELEDEAVESDLVVPRWPSQYLGRDSGLESLVSQSELEHWVWAEPRFQAKHRSDVRSRPRRTPPPAGAGHWLRWFTSGAIPKYPGADGKPRSTACSVYVPNAAWKQSVIDLLVFFHGDPGPCSQFDPNPMNTRLKFGLDRQINGSGRRVALAVPAVHWIRGKSKNLQGKWTAENLNKFVEEVRDEIGKQSGVKPTIGRLIIAGHSHAFAILNPLADEFYHGAEATKEGALAKLSDVWALDSTYGADGISARKLDAWARALPEARFIGVLWKGRAPDLGWDSYLNNLGRLRKRPPPNLKRCRVGEDHCTIPTKYIGQLLSATSYPPSWCTF